MSQITEKCIDFHYWDQEMCALHAIVPYIRVPYIRVPYIRDLYLESHDGA